MPQLHITNAITQQQQHNNNNLINIQNDAANVSASMSMDIDEDVVGATSGVDLENELREFLESGPGLAATSNADDNNIVAQLLMN